MTYVVEGALAVVAASGWLAWLRQTRRSKQTSPPPDAITAFRRRVLAAHATAFELHTAVLAAFEDALVKERHGAGRLSIAIDMLMYQAFKSDGTISLLARTDCSKTQPPLPVV